MKTTLRISFLLIAFLGLVTFGYAQGGPVKSQEKQISASKCKDESKADFDLQCAKVYRPVCGCDGVTYANACEAKRRGVQSYKDGTCPGSVEKEIEKSVGDLEKAYNGGNAKAIGAMFKPHAILTQADGSVAQGSKVITTQHAQLFENGAPKASFQIQDMIPICAEKVYVSGVYTLEAVGKAASKDAQQNGTFVTLWEKVDGTWQILRHQANKVWEGYPMPTPDNNVKE